MNEPKLCNICKAPLGMTPMHEDCGGDCLSCMAAAGDTDCQVKLAFIQGFNAACDLLRRDSDKEIDKYGIGNMCSQWTAEDVADDLQTRIEEVLK